MASQVDDKRLSTWAEIAAYIGRDVRTARRYETERGLPVRRLPGSRSTVFALVSELDAWRAGALLEPQRTPPTDAPTAPSPQPAPALPPPWWQRRWVSAGAIAAAAAVSVTWAVLSRPPAGAATETSVIIAALQNDTGDAVFDRLIPRLTQVELMQSPRLQVASDSRVAQTLGLMERPRDAILTPALAREVCVRGNGGVLVTPGAARLDTRYVLTLVASDCVSGRGIAQEREVVSAKGDVPQALERLVARTRRRLGESRASIARFDVPLAAVRTASFDALRAYSEAAWLRERGKDVEAIPLFRRAIELDAGLGLAWLDLAQTYYHARQWREDADAMVHAYALRGSMSERDQLFSGYRYHYIVEKDLVSAQDNLKALALIYPRDASILSSLSYLQFDLGEYEEAIASAEQAVRSDPRSAVARTRLMLALIRSGRLAAARTVGDEAFKAGVQDSRLNEMRILASAEMGDAAEARRLVEAVVGSPGERDALLQYASVVFGAGRSAAFDSMVDRADLLGRRQGVRMDWTAVGAALADMGAVERARRRLALVEPDLRVGRFHRAQALAGDAAQVETDLARDEARWPRDTLRNAEYAPEARAVLALRRGDAQAAARAMSAPDPYLFRTLEFPYVRAQTLLATGDAASAASVFRAILAHPGWSNWPQYPLSHLGLARALRLRGDVDGSRREYAAFLAAWGGADADLPQVAQARAELISLVAPR